MRPGQARRASWPRKKAVVMVSRGETGLRAGRSVRRVGTSACSANWCRCWTRSPRKCLGYEGALRRHRRACHARAAVSEAGPVPWCRPPSVVTSHALEANRRRPAEPGAGSRNSWPMCRVRRMVQRDRGPHRFGSMATACKRRPEPGRRRSTAAARRCRARPCAGAVARRAIAAKRHRRSSATRQLDAVCPTSRHGMLFVFRVFERVSTR